MCDFFGVSLCSRSPSFLCDCSFVRQFCELYGKFPVSSSGKLLQDVLIATPGVSLVGGKPSKIFVSLQEDGTAAAMTTTKEGGAAKVEGGGGGGGGGRREVEHSLPPPVAPPTAQSNLADISAAFMNLLINSPNCELPYRYVYYISASAVCVHVCIPFLFFFLFCFL